MGEKHKSAELSGNNYRVFFDDSPIPGYILDAETLRFVDVNKMALSLYGYSKEEFLCMNINDIRPAGDTPVFLQASPNKDNKGVIDNGIWKHVRKNGELFYVQVYYHFSRVNNAPAIIVQCIDVNDKVLAERKNRELMHTVKNQKDRLDYILSTVNEVVWATDLADMELLYTNDACYGVYGYTPAEMMADKNLFLQSIHPEDRNKFFASVTLAKTQGHSHEEFRVRHKDGSIKYLLGTATLKKGEDGHRDILSGVTVDITQQRMSEQALREKISELEGIQNRVFVDQQNLLAVINNTKDLVWAIDADYKLTIVNEPFKQVMQNRFGYTPAPGTDVTTWHTYTPKADFWASQYSKAFAGETFSIIDDEVVNGETFYFKVNFNPIFGEKGHVIGVSCFGEDVTMQRRQLIRIQLQNERLKEIAWIQSHKVRGPVASILGLAQLFNYHNVADPINMEILNGFKEATSTLDKVIEEINDKTVMMDYKLL